MTLRIATDEAGQDLVPTRTEAKEAEFKARQEAENARAAEAEARKLAESRVRELEAELKRPDSGK